MRTESWINNDAAKTIYSSKLFNHLTESKTSKSKRSAPIFGISGWPSILIMSKLTTKSSQRSRSKKSLNRNKFILTVEVKRLLRPNQANLYAYLNQNSETWSLSAKSRSGSNRQNRRSKHKIKTHALLTTMKSSSTYSNNWNERLQSIRLRVQRDNYCMTSLIAWSSVWRAQTRHRLRRIAPTDLQSNQA